MRRKLTSLWILAAALAAGPALARPEPDVLAGLRAAAEKGDPQAQYDLSLQLLYGADVDPATRDTAAGLSWVRKAAEGGLVEAQRDLGTRYSLGQDVKEDRAESVRWFRKAAEQGDAESRFHLGVAYQYGQGVELDLAEA